MEDTINSLCIILCANKLPHIVVVCVGGKCVLRSRKEMRMKSICHDFQNDPVMTELCKD